MKHRQRSQGGVVNLYVNNQLERMELCLGMDKELIKSLCARIKGRAGTGDIIAGVCYRPPDQEDQVNEALYTDRSSLTFTSPGPHGGLQRPQYVLEGQHNRA